MGELLLLLRTLGRGAPTPGAALLNLRYRDERAVSGETAAARTGLEGRGLSVTQRVQLGAWPQCPSYTPACMPSCAPRPEEGPSSLNPKLLWSARSAAHGRWQVCVGAPGQPRGNVAMEPAVPNLLEVLFLASFACSPRPRSHNPTHRRR